jgi:bifunctional non-homologous end joining protein LigD
LIPRSAAAGALNIPGQAILDGEVVVIHEGRTNFSELQAELAAGRQDRLVYYAFDLLWRDRDLRKLPQVERKRMLSDLLGENDIGHPVIYSEHLTGDGQKMFEHATKLNFEGIVSKNAQAPYRSDRNEGWLKIKTVQQGKFPVIGSSRIRAGWPRCISESAREKISSTWARSGPAGRERSRARSGNSLIPSSARNPS